MRIGYKIRSHGTEKNDWVIAVIYDLDGWPARSLKHQGLADYQFTREATEIEKEDYSKYGNTRCYYSKYTDVKGFVEDENLCGVEKDFIDKVVNFYNEKTKTLNS